MRQADWRGVGAAPRGYSLLELLVVLTILMIVAALAVAGMRSSKKAAYEAVTLSYLRTISEAQVVYQIRNHHFAGDFETLSGAGFIEAPLASRLGYNLVLRVDSGAERWEVRATPVTPGTTGDRYFYIATEGVIRAALDGPADAGSPVINTG